MADTFSFVRWKSALLRAGLTLEHESADEAVFATEPLVGFQPARLGATPSHHHRYDLGGGRFVSVVRLRKAPNGLAIREVASALRGVGLSLPTMGKLLAEARFRRG